MKKGAVPHKNDALPAKSKLLERENSLKNFMYSLKKWFPGNLQAVRF